MNLAGKSVLVTGASSGIGAALALEMAKRGAAVGICARREDKLAEVVAGCRQTSPASAMWALDLAAAGAAEDLAARALEHFGRVDVLVNNAGVPLRRHVSRLSADDAERVMQINYIAAVRLTLAILPGMLARGSGHIVNVCSVAATLSSPNESAYDASKAALTAFSEAMAVDLWDSGVHVMVVHPGLIDTELLDAPGQEPLVEAPTERLPVSDAVEAVLTGLERDARQVYIPAFFEELAAGKARDVPAFLAGAAEFMAQQRSPAPPV
jgi:short-subunit dehydrogenase